MSYDIEFWDEDKYTSLKGQVIEMPIIPREGDYVNLQFTSDGNNHTGVWRVKRVYLNQSSKEIKAEVHVTADDNPKDMEQHILSDDFGF